MCAIVYYTKWMKGRLYPRAARTGPYAYAQEVARVNGRVVAKYLAIVRLPERQKAVGSREANEKVVEEGESDAKTRDVVERGEGHDIDPGEPS